MVENKQKKRKRRARRNRNRKSALGPTWPKSNWMGQSANFRFSTNPTPLGNIIHNPNVGYIHPTDSLQRLEATSSASSMVQRYAPNVQTMRVRAPRVTSGKSHAHHLGSAAIGASKFGLLGALGGYVGSGGLKTLAEEYAYMSKHPRKNGNMADKLAEAIGGVFITHGIHPNQHPLGNLPVGNTAVQLDLDALMPEREVVLTNSTHPISGITTAMF